MFIPENKKGLYSEILQSKVYEDYALGFQIGMNKTWNDLHEYYVYIELWFWTIEIGIRV